MYYLFSFLFDFMAPASMATNASVSKKKKAKNEIKNRKDFVFSERGRDRQSEAFWGRKKD